MSDVCDKVRNICGHSVLSAVCAVSSRPSLYIIYRFDSVIFDKQMEYLSGPLRGIAPHPSPHQRSL